MTNFNLSFMSNNSFENFASGSAVYVLLGYTGNCFYYKSHYLLYSSACIERVTYYQIP